MRKKGRLDIRSRHQDACKALEYNILKRHEKDDLQSWKSYPGLKEIVRIARDIIENRDKKDITKLVNMMRVHESQQSAAVVSTIAAIVGGTLKNEVSKEIREAIGDIILWDVPLIKNEDDWPQRKKYSTKNVYDNEEDEKNTKLIVHGYLGQKASKEMEQLHTKGELRRIAHYEDGVWIAPTRSTFKSYLPDVFPEKPYIIHQNSPLAWSLLSFIHQQQDTFPARSP